MVVPLWRIDVPEACDALTKLLSSLGATTCAATSAQAGLGKLDGVPYDAIVADIEMPVEDGFFCTRSPQTGTEWSDERAHTASGADGLWSG
jgi:CheY-like chemotaxis protein